MKPTLVIMAAGMGSRYGGLKQIDPIGPNGEIIMEYSIYDAIRAGFGKVVFVIRQEFEDIFREKIGSKIEKQIEVSYVQQELDKCLGGFDLPKDREKPWGTGHAVLVCKDAVKEPFTVINADDFYGANAFRLIAEYLTRPDASQRDYSMVGYILRNTVSENGYVSRGVCKTDENEMLIDVEEYLKIEKNGNEAIHIKPDGSTEAMSGDETVSMNFWGFQPGLFPQLEALFAQFLAEKGKELKSEFFIPFVVDDMIKSGKATVKVLKTSDKWYGVTYQQDREPVKAGIKALIDSGQYPRKLWE
ncbi:UDP-N-acetylglucosamine diphosphorylase/glucosamine-1-phosphate N-acetyltransferase [Limihaloglobus sulfuriphilus]|uniref:UDP-N-acetylglucosamine diphosphorylase/glucosamine-1-phosphate N-acetyltransferase n=1 Tax=Limihaloglobus sulfuriphilus TaxID=1851148 RepID=A0A1Q2MDS6_9BACT|nr:sugar phosphate nucleotidyltransferase [Limihaloglobus sulfuriphilus]AQQ70856.1 UDP-N-acetylglucosamine diphosphorylase/glucosamine-1-phosphate N-acetyltransferase [Limihaloglobus sulfuriphilus]